MILVDWLFRVFVWPQRPPLGRIRFKGFSIWTREAEIERPTVASANNSASEEER